MAIEFLKTSEPFDVGRSISCYLCLCLRNDLNVFELYGFIVEILEAARCVSSAISFDVMDDIQSLLTLLERLRIIASMDPTAVNIATYMYRFCELTHC